MDNNLKGLNWYKIHRAVPAIQAIRQVKSVGRAIKSSHPAMLVKPSADQIRPASQPASHACQPRRSSHSADRAVYSVGPVFNQTDGRCHRTDAGWSPDCIKQYFKQLINSRILQNVSESRIFCHLIQQCGKMLFESLSHRIHRRFFDTHEGKSLLKHEHIDQVTLNG